MDLIHFQQYVGESLIMSGKFVRKKRGGPPNSGETNSHVHTKTRVPAIRPVVDVRHDGLDHLPENSTKKSRRLQGKNIYLLLKVQSAFVFFKGEKLFFGLSFQVK